MVKFQQSANTLPASDWTVTREMFRFGLRKENSIALALMRTFEVIVLDELIYVGGNPVPLLSPDSGLVAGAYGDSFENLPTGNFVIAGGRHTLTLTGNGIGSYCQKSWMGAETQAANLSPSLKITPATTAGSNVLPLSFRQ